MAISPRTDEPPPNRNGRAVIYLRVASDKPRDIKAIELQRHACERIAAKHGINIVREYRDVGISARLARQVALQRLLRDIAAKQDAAHVIVWGYPVLAGDMWQLDDIVSELAGYQTKVLTITGVETVQRGTSDGVIDAVLDSDPARREIQNSSTPARRTN